MALVFRHRPQQYGLSPDGETLSLETPTSRPRRQEVDFPFRRASSHPNILVPWSAVFTLWTLVHGAVISQLISALTLDGEVSRNIAGIAGAAVPLFSLIGRLGFGTLSDFVDKNLVVVISLVIQAVGLVLFVNPATPFFALAGSFFYGVGSGGVIPVRSALQADLFGARNFGAIQGGLRFLATAGGISGTHSWPALSPTYEDSYALFYFISIGALALTAVFVILLRQPRARRRVA